MNTPAGSCGFRDGRARWRSDRGSRGAQIAAAGVLAVGAAIAAAPGAGAEKLGDIEARVGDTEMHWHTISTERYSGTIASASIRIGPRLTEINIQGHPEVGFTSRDLFIIDIRYLGQYAPEAVPMSVDIHYMPGGMGGPFWISNPAASPATVRVLALDVWGGLGRIDALFAGELCFRKMISAAPDKEMCREVTGRVETELFVDYGAARGAVSK